ncbi:MAG TPA: pyridoxine 5'-phosphate synthase [Polyangiaceae bacterium]|nr:pyridoxine 5'-phosphate synthase [Polyangiaceae bacterium]
MPTRLSVNLNKVATLRNTRRVGVPSLKHCARLCLDAGAAGITVHPRPDQRHVRPHDLDDLAEVLAAYPAAELNIEGNPFHGVVEHAEKFKPSQCTLVPDDPSQATSDHGWDLKRDAERLRPIAARLRAVGCRVSLFVDPVADDMTIAAQLGADRVELYTEPYASAFARGDATRELAACRDAALAAQSAGLGVNAGHDLNRENLGPFLIGVREVLEVSIGHALVADALELGLAETVRRYLAIVNAPSRAPSERTRGCP